MASNYNAFDVETDNDDGTLTPVPGAAVEVRDFTDPEAVVRLLPDLVADGAGHVASGALAVGPGSSIRFTWKDEGSGVCGYAEQVTF